MKRSVIEKLKRMKSVRKIWLSAIRLKNEISTYKAVKKYLDRGFYCFGSDNSLSKTFHPGHIFFFVGEKKRDDSLSSILSQKSLSYAVGGAKNVLLTSEKAIAFYRDHSSYIHSKNNYVNYIEKFCYPSIRQIQFDDEKELAVMERVYGSQYNDRYHNTDLSSFPAANAELAKVTDKI